MAMELYKLVRVGWERKIAFSLLEARKKQEAKENKILNRPKDFSVKGGVKLDDLLEKASNDSLFDDKFWPDDLDNEK